MNKKCAKIKYVLTCELDKLSGFIPNKYNTYVFYPGLQKGKYLFIDTDSKEIEFSDIKVLALLNNNYIKITDPAQIS